MRKPLTKLTLLLLLGTSSLALAGYKDEIGYTRLIEEFGEQVPNGAGIPVAQIEYVRSNTWAPEATGELAEVNFIYDPVDTGAFSTHAFGVGRFFYGSNSIAPGIDQVYSFPTSRWYTNIDFTRNREPRKNPWRIENHSWGGSTGFEASDLQIIGRLDYRILHQNIFASVGLDNHTGAMWPLLANTYNSIVVGVASGNHNRGGTNLYTSGRKKPDIVAPLQYTSHSTPVVAAAAAILIDRAEQEDALLEAAQAPLVKALLMAGATKNAFPNWSNSPTQPLDQVYGAGSLNIFNSYKILLGGKQARETSHPDRAAGWDWGTTDESSALYPFDVTTSSDGVLSAVLAWNAIPEPDQDDSGNLIWIRYNYRLDNLVLKLWKVDEHGQLQDQITESISVIDNVQHIYLTDLAPGAYALEISGSATGVSYGLAWRAFREEAEGSAPSIIASPVDASLSVTTTAVLKVAASGSGDVRYQWRKNSAPLVDDGRISGASTPELTISDLKAQDEGAYCVVVTNEFGSAVCEPAALELLPFVPPLVWERAPGATPKIATADLLTGAIGSDEGPVSLALVSSVSGKGIEIDHDGEWVYYLPPDDFEEEDSFTLTVTDSLSREAAGTVQVVVKESAGASPTGRELLAFERVTGTNDLFLRYAGLPGAVYIIETSTDLTNWHPLATVTAASDGTYAFQHANAFEDQQRFYRTVSQ